MKRDRKLLPRRSTHGVHWLPGWPTPPMGVIIHFAATGTASYTREILLRRGLSSHVVIERDGSVVDLVDPGNRARHSGGGRWAGRSALNNRYLGIELVNFGDGAGPFTGAVPSGVTLFRWDEARPTDPEVQPDETGRWFRDETYRGRVVRVVTQQRMVRASVSGDSVVDHRTHAQGRY